jgi:hypothetical protein
MREGGREGRMTGRTFFLVDEFPSRRPLWLPLAFPFSNAVAPFVSRPPFVILRRVVHIERGEGNDNSALPHTETVMFLQRWPLQIKHKRIIRLEKLLRIEISGKLTKYAQWAVSLTIQKTHSQTEKYKR